MGADEPQSLQTLEAVLKPIMWRNDKASVGDELMLPPRTLEVSSLYGIPTNAHHVYQVMQSCNLSRSMAIFHSSARHALHSYGGMPCVQETVHQCWMHEWRSRKQR